MPHASFDEQGMYLTFMDLEKLRSHLLDTIFVMVGSPYEDVSAIISKTRLILNEMGAK